MEIKIYVSILSLIFLTSSCDKDFKPNKLEVKNINFSNCLNNSEKLSSNLSCLSIQFTDDDSLKIKHYNSEFCCGTEKLDIQCTLRNDSIIIKEIDLGPFTYCFCKHDIDFEIGPLAYGVYNMQLIESEHSYKRDTFLIKFSYTDTLNILTCN
jgi:hypothetical protein